MPEPLPVLHIDEADGDWIKRGAWDIRLGGELVDNLPDLYEALYDAGIHPAEFKTFDVYLANVGKMPWLRAL